MKKNRVIVILAFILIIATFFYVSTIPSVASIEESNKDVEVKIIIKTYIGLIKTFQVAITNKRQDELSVITGDSFIALIEISNEKKKLYIPTENYEDIGIERKLEKNETIRGKIYTKIFFGRGWKLETKINYQKESSEIESLIINGYIK